MELLILWALSGLVGTAILSRDKKAGTITRARETSFTLLNCPQPRESGKPGRGKPKGNNVKEVPSATHMATHTRIVPSLCED